MTGVMKHGSACEMVDLKAVAVPFSLLFVFVFPNLDFCDLSVALKGKFSRTSSPTSVLAA